MERLQPLREALVGAGLIESVVSKLMDTGGPGVPKGPVIERRTRGRGPRHTIALLFLSGESVEASDAAAALKPAGLGSLESLGLLVREGERVRSEAQIVPRLRQYLLSDFPAESGGAGGGAMKPDHVIGSGPAPMTLARMVPRRRVANAMDMGAGSGVQAFQLAGHCDWVVATDTNPRALRFGRWGAGLNGLSNIAWCRGSFFEPIAERRFGLVVSNPPFVISPESRWIFRDGGLGGDAVSETTVRGAAARLAEGGVAVMLINWIHRSDKQSARRPLEWARGSGCDAWLLRDRGDDPVGYAAKWMSATERHDAETFGRRLDEWVSYFESLGAERVSPGVMILQRRRAGADHAGAANWQRVDTVPGMGSGGCGEQIQRVVDAETWLHGEPSREAWRGLRPTLAPGCRLHRTLGPGTEGWAVAYERLVPAAGLPLEAAVDPEAMALLPMLDGSMTLGAFVERLRQRTGKPREEAEASCIEGVKQLLRAGLLSLDGAMPGHPAV